MATRIELCGVPFDTHSVAEFLDEARFLLQHREAQPRTLLCVNAHIHTLARRDDALREVLRESRVVTMDGMGVVLAARLSGEQVSERCNMTEALRAFLAADDMPLSRCLLIGCSSHEAETAARTMNALSRHCTVVATCSGYLPDADYVAFLQRYPDIDGILVGMGTPKTERITRLAARCVPRAMVWGIGGGTIRIFAGAMREAPPVLRKLGLQWLHRLCCEPANLWRRYILGNPVFLSAVLRDVVTSRLRGLAESAHGE